jgi:ornithine cyclodeaminase
MPNIAIISEDDVRKYANQKMAYKAIRQAFIALTCGNSALFPVAIGSGGPKDSMIAIKSGLLSKNNIVGLKVGTYWPENFRFQKPNHGSTTLLLDPKTGFPMALINASRLNGLRTAAANAVATDLLSNPKAKTLLIIGTGHQAHYELQALCEIRSFTQIYIWGRNQEKAQIFAQSVENNGPFCSVVTNLEQATKEADVIVTATTATHPLIKTEWVQHGTHISAMGADTIGKQELPPSLLAKSILFADYPKQSKEIGEFQHLEDNNQPIKAIGTILSSDTNIFDSENISIFDSSGIALQDISIAFQIYQQLLDCNALKVINF